MQWFVVKYRKPDGTMTEAEFEAADKSALFKLLAEKKISAVNVREGRLGKRSVAKKRSSNAHTMLARGIVAAVAVVTCALAGMYFIKRDEARGLESVQNQKVKEQVIKDTKQKDAPQAQDEVAVKEKWTPENDRVHRDAEGHIVYDKDAPLGSKANPINIDAMKFPNNPIQPKRKLFDTRAENYVCGLMRTKPGTRIIPSRLPPNFDEEFKAHIADPVHITDEDTEEDIAYKQQMHEFKKVVAGLIGDGMTPTEIILQERKELNRIADHRAVCAAEIGRLKREGASEQEIADCVEAANKVMEQYGARKFMTTAQIKEMLFEKSKP